MQIFNLPDLYESPKSFVNYVINNKQYTFQFDWTGDFALCTAYFVANNVNQYLFKGRPIVINTDLTGRIKDKNYFDGHLVLMNVYGQSVDPIQENFSSDYQLVYYTEEDLTNVN